MDPLIYATLATQKPRPPHDPRHRTQAADGWWRSRERLPWSALPSAPAVADPDPRDGMMLRRGLAGALRRVADWIDAGRRPRPAASDPC